MRTRSRTRWTASIEMETTTAPVRPVVALEGDGDQARRPRHEVGHGPVAGVDGAGAERLHPVRGLALWWWWRR